MQNQDERPAELTASEENPILLGEDVVTVGELVQDMEEMEETAEALFGSQDPSVCTYPEGYKPRQTVFACLTCIPEPGQAGVCYGCSLNCHDGHNIVELYTKRKFQCDCGNSKFGDKKCTLYEEKDAENKYNNYNHNYNGKFCTCDVFYPEDDADVEYFQCEICEDWFHENHIEWKTIKFEDQASVGENRETAATSTVTTGSHEKKPDSSIICVTCVKKLPFLLHLITGKESFCHSKLSLEEKEPVALEIAKFRERLCKCADCVRVYETAGCEFLLDDEDDIGTYERESKKKAQENKVTPEEEMRTLVRTYGMEGAQMLYSGVNDLKRKLGEFLSTRTGAKPVSSDEVKTFFATLTEENRQKRGRFE